MPRLASTVQTSSLMPSPLHASGPQNEMEQRLQRLIVEGINSGEAVEYASAAEFAHSMRERGVARRASSGVAAGQS
jgi:uncharacterized protein YoaH (UPF0181 family)